MADNKEFIRRLLQHVRTVTGFHAGGRRRKPPRWAPPARAERRYHAAIVALLARYEQVIREQLYPALDRLSRLAAPTRMNSWADDLAVLRKAMRVSIAGPEQEAITAATSVDISEWNLAQWKKISIATLGVDITQAEPWLRDSLKAWAAENASLIESLQVDQIAQVERWTASGLRKGQRPEEIQAKIEERFGVSRSRAKLLARDQTAKLNGDLTEKRQRDAGVERYVWRTSRDERVRGNPAGKYPDAKPSHYVMEGKICRWDDPTVYLSGKNWVSRASIGGVELHPGEDYQDRCTAEPIMDDLLEGLRDAA